MRAFLWFFTGLWFLGSWWYYNCKIKEVCMKKPSLAAVEDSEENTSNQTKEIPVASFPLFFNWSNGNANTGEGFEDFRDSIVGSIREGEALEIIGHYYPGEKNNTGYANLGLARAEAIKKLFSSFINPDKIKTKGARKESKQENLSNRVFSSAGFNRIPDNEYVKTVEDKALIYFPSASTDMLANVQINNYLHDIADLLKRETSKKVSLTGHTDGTGSGSLNMKLSRQRANQVRDILLGYGVSPGQIRVISKGETEPIANNKTPEGRRKNRRVELELL